MEKFLGSYVEFLFVSTMTQRFFFSLLQTANTFERYRLCCILCTIRGYPIYNVFRVDQQNLFDQLDHKYLALRWRARS